VRAVDADGADGGMVAGKSGEIQFLEQENGPLRSIVYDSSIKPAPGMDEPFIQHHPG
jgi:hypothetical protein